MKALACSLAGQTLSAALTAILAFLLVTCSCSLAFAEGTYRIAYEGSAKGLVSADRDFFAHFGTLLPGDTLTGTVQVRNDSQATQSLGFRADPTRSSQEGPADLLRKLQLTVRSGEALLYQGPLSADELGSTVELGSFSPKEKADLDFAVSCPADLGNSYALSSADVCWVFTAISEGGAAGAGPGTPAPGSSSPQASDDGVTLAKTGASTALLTGLAAALALAAALSLSNVGRRKKRYTAVAPLCPKSEEAAIPEPQRAKESAQAGRPSGSPGFAMPLLLALLLATSTASLALITTGGSALAHFVDCTDSTTNQLSAGENTIQIEEEFPAATDPKPGSWLVKKVRVRNTGNSPSYVRVLVSFSNGEAQKSCALDFDRTNWERGEDGYDYYRKPLEPGQATEHLFTTVSIAGSAPAMDSGTVSPFDLDVKAESTFADPALSPAEAFARTQQQTE